MKKFRRFDLYNPRLHINKTPNFLREVLLLPDRDLLLPIWKEFEHPGPPDISSSQRKIQNNAILNFKSHEWGPDQFFKFKDTVLLDLDRSEEYLGAEGQEWSITFYKCYIFLWDQKYALTS